MRALLKKRLRTIVVFAVWCAVVGLIVGLIIGLIDERVLAFSGLRGSSAGILIGTAVGMGEEFILPRWSRQMGFVRLSVLRVSAYALTILLVLILVKMVSR